jgi:hypothetical protein
VVYTDPLNKSFCNVNSSANDPAKSSRMGFGAPLLAVSVSAKQSQSFSIASDGMGLSLPTELAFELALCRKSGDNWKFPLVFGRGAVVVQHIFSFICKKGQARVGVGFLLFVDRDGN